MILNLTRLLLAFGKDFRTIQWWERRRLGLVLFDHLFFRLQRDVNRVMGQVKQKWLLPA